jgi:phytoene synthase
VTREEAYERCRGIARQEARNFYYGFVLLPPERRAGIYAAYAFSRRCDDSVDGDEPLEVKLAAVAARRRELDAVYGGTPGGDAVLVALADAVERFGIPRRHLDALVEGVEMDLTRTRYEDWPALRAYCDRVAGAVGLVSLHVFGFSSPDAPRYAAELGVALQLVNIMRDVAEDASRGRIYLPLDEMAEHGVREEDLLLGVAGEGFHDLMRAQGQRARAYFTRGERLLPLLDRRARVCVATMAGLYRGILDEIERRDYEVLGGRVSLGPARKLAVTAGRVAGTGLRP